MPSTLQLSYFLLILNENLDEQLQAMGNGSEGKVQEGDIRLPC